MTLPIEAVLALLSLNGAFITVVCHLLIRVLNSMNKLTNAFDVAEARNEEKFRNLARSSRSIGQVNFNQGEHTQ